MHAVKCATVAIAAQDVNKVMSWAVDSEKFHQSVTVLRLATAEAGLEEEECILHETLRHERDRMKQVSCRDVQSKRMSARDGPGNWTNRTLKVVCEMDTSAGQENGRSEANNLIFIWNVTSHADETEIMGGDCSVSNTAAYDCRMLVFIRGNSDTIDDDETGKKAGHCAPGNAVRWKHCGPIQATSIRSRESYDMEPSTTALNNTTVVFWHGPWVLVWLMVVADDTIGWSAIVV